MCCRISKRTVFSLAGRWWSLLRYFSINGCYLEFFKWLTTLDSANCVTAIGQQLMYNTKFQFQFAVETCQELMSYTNFRICRKQAFWLAVENLMTSFNQSDCIIPEKHSTKLKRKFVYNLNSGLDQLAYGREWILHMCGGTLELIDICLCASFVSYGSIYAH